MDAAFVYEWIVFFLTLHGYSVAIWKLLVFVVVPVIVLTWPHVMSHVIWMSRLGTPMTSYDVTSYPELENGRNLKIIVNESEIAAWHIPPKGTIPKTRRRADSASAFMTSPSVAEVSDEHAADATEIQSATEGFSDDRGVNDGGSWSDGRPVFVYCHGQFGSRAEEYRRRLYAVVSQEYHVIAWDYRGFADSSAASPSPTEASMVADALAVYQHVKSRAGKAPILIWGHTLGTGVAAHVARDLGNLNLDVAGVILSASFFHLEDLIRTHKFFFWAGLPFYERLMLDAVAESGFAFYNCDHVVRIAAPIMILHCDEDQASHFPSGFRLYEISKRRTNGYPRQFCGFVGYRGYGHYNIADAVELPKVLESFVARCLHKKRTDGAVVNLRDNDDLLMLETRASALSTGRTIIGIEGISTARIKKLMDEED